MMADKIPTINCLSGSIDKLSGGGVSSDLSLFSRRIEFHLARKPFNGFTNGAANFRLETLNPNSNFNYSNNGTSSSSNQPKNDSKSAVNGKKSDGTEENGLDPELSFGIIIRRIGAGLENLGNTCFLNSVLQCLTYTEPLAAYLQSGKHQTSCRKAGFCALCAIQKHVSRALQSTGRILAPKEIVVNLRCISRNFRISRQEDAHEYMVNLLESMHKCCLPSGVPSESPSAYDKSLVHKIFGGRLRSQVKCMQCSFCSNKFDPFLDLSLEINKAESLHKALYHFTAKELLDGGERHYQCQHCKQKVKAFKQLSIDKAPYVLTIHLKRFGSHLAGQKIDKKVQFGPTLDLKPFVTDPHDGDLKYTLYGVLVHAGWTTHSGHYYCFVRTSSGMWYSLDDNRVFQVSEKKVLDQKAYMLFYYRDKRNVALKKPLDVAQKEIMATNSMGRHKPCINVNQELNGNTNTDRIETRVNDKFSAAAVAQRDPLNAAGSLEIPTTVVPNQTILSFKKAECSALKDCTLQERPPRVTSVKDSVKGYSVTSHKDGECSMKQDSSVKGSILPCEPDRAMITKSNAKLDECDLYKSSEKDIANIVTIPPSCNSFLKLVADKDLSDSGTISPNTNECVNSKKDLDVPIAVSPNCCVTQRLSGDIKMAKNPSRKIGDETSSLDPSVRMREKMPLNATRGESALGRLDAKLAELSKTIPAEKKCLEGRHGQKFKKKLPKCPMFKMHLTSKLLFGASLSVRKKKHKRSKKCPAGNTIVCQKHLLDGDSLSLDLQPSTSDRYTTMPSGSASTQKKGKKRDSKKKEKFVENNVLSKPNNSFLTDITDKEVIDRTGQNSALPAVVDQSQMSSGIVTSSGCQLDVGELNNSTDSRRDSMHNGLISMLTRGLEETVVARWDDVIQSNPSHISEQSVLQNVSIGYVGDEWDEEYDRGKRKKVRAFKNDFDGSNPFQEIANNRSKLKKAKTTHSSSRNMPCRI